MKRHLLILMLFTCLLLPGCGGDEEQPLGEDEQAREVEKSGGKIAFVTDRDGNKEIYLMTFDGKNPVNLTRTPDEDEFFPAWSPNGKQIAFSDGGEGYAALAVGRGPNP